MRDAEAAHAWQANLLADIGQHRKDTSQAIPLTLHGKKLTFVCVDLRGGSNVLFCDAVGTDLTVATRASSSTSSQETRAILETSE